MQRPGSAGPARVDHIPPVPDDCNCKRKSIGCFLIVGAAARVMPVTTFRIGEAAELLGVSDDTVRRWVDAGPAAADRDEHGHRAIDGADLAGVRPVAGRRAGRADRDARRRATGCAASSPRVIRDTVMAQVDIQAGPFRVVSLMSREAADELGLSSASVAVAVIKSTTVVVERTGGSAMRTMRLRRPRSRSPPCSLAGCGGGGDSRRPGAGSAAPRPRPAVTGTVTVFAAASLTESFTADRQGLRGGQPGHQGDVQLRRQLGLASRSTRARRPTCSPRPARRT